jgi:subtilisin family serine protease
VIGVIVMIAVPSAARAQLDGAAIPGSYIALYSGSGDAAARAAERVGGKVVFNHAGAGVLIVRSAPLDFAAKLSAIVGFSNVLADRWIVQSTLGQVVGRETLTGISSSGITSFSPPPFNALLLPKQWNIFQTQTDSAWAITQGDPSVKVAIVDTGICMHHDDLAGKIDLELSTSFVPAAEEPADTAEPACIGCPTWEDRHGHGTWVASVVSTNNLGVAGVAPKVRLVAVKVANHRDVGSISALIRGVLYAADVGSDVINVSRAYGEHPIAEFPRGMALLQRTFAYATRQGALLVIGAGNDGVDLDHAGSAIAVPCDITNGMCIGATTVSDALASYSNHGVSAVTMVAPGGGVPTDPLPDTALNTSVIVACSVHAMDGGCTPHNYFLVAGTSFAAPMVSGAAALVVSRNPHLKGKPQQVKAALVNSADDLGEAGTDNLFSKGRLNTPRAVQ